MSTEEVITSDTRPPILDDGHMDVGGGSSNIEGMGV